MMRLAFVLLLLASCSAMPGGCDPMYLLTDEPVYTAEQISFETGRGIRLQLTNRTSETLWYNLCTASLQEKTDKGWVPVEAGWLPPDHACTLELRSLPPGESDTFEGPLRDDLQVGTYRFEDQIGVGEEDLTTPIYSDAFELRE